MKKILMSVVGALSLVSAQAAEQNWSFSYTGMYLSQWRGDEFWDANKVMSGMFSGNDSNHDGVLTRNEVTHFTIDGTGLDFANCANSDMYFTCNLADNFRFQIGVNPPVFFAHSFEVIEGEGLYQNDYRQSGHNYHVTPWLNAGGNGSDWMVTSATRFVINGQTAPVPEPESWAMMLAGMGLLGMVVRRRKANLLA